MNKGLKNQHRKEVNHMQNNFEAPVLTLIGQAGEVVMGNPGSGFDLPDQSVQDFEFEDDSL